MADLGFVSNNNDPYVYAENNAGRSVSLGIDSVTNSFRITVASSPGAFPGAASSQIIINPAGNITIDPTNLLIVDGSVEIVNSLKIDTLSAGVMRTDASGNVSSFTGSNGQVIIGGGAAPIWANLTSTGGSVTITNGVNSINLEASGVAALTQLNGDTGSATPTAGIITIAGGNLLTSTAAASTVTLDITGGTNGQVIVAATAGSPTFSTLTSSGGTITYTTGANTLNIDGTNATTTQIGMVALATNAETINGSNTTKAVTPDDLKAKLGLQTAFGVMLGAGQTSALGVTAVGSTNTVLLGNTGANPFFGSVPNAALANSTITLNNGNNISISGSPVALGGAATINVSGTTNHAVQVGNASASLTSLAVGTNGQVLLGATSADPAFATLTSTDNTITYTTGAHALNIDVADKVVTTIDGDTGSATGFSHTINVKGSTNIHTIASGNTVNVYLNDSVLLPTTTGASAGVIALGTNITNDRFLHNYGANVFVGDASGNFTLSGDGSTGVGNNVLQAMTSATVNNAFGQNCLVAATTSGHNCGYGNSSLTAVTTGNGHNTGFGNQTLQNITTGAYNTCLGFTAGGSLSGSNSSNLLLQNDGTAGDNNTIRIGTQGTGNGQQNRAFIAGVAGVTVSSSAIVLINTGTGQLGTVVSSRRYKEDISPLDTSYVTDLEPVTFRYKESPQEIHYGLIAEDVEKIIPDLVIYKDDLPESVKYHEIPMLLLAEIKNLKERIKILEENYGK